MSRTLCALAIAAALVLGGGCNTNEECPSTVVAIDFPKAVDDCLTDQEESDLRAGNKTWNQVWSALKARCPGVAAHDNGAAVYALTLHPKGIKVQGKKDMAGKLEKFAKDNKCCVKNLRISGHGSPGQFSTGDGQKRVDCKYVNGNDEQMAAWKRDLAGLKNVLCKKGSTLLIDACSTGAGETGLKKMQELAKEYGVTVVAATGTCDGTPAVEDLPSDKMRTVTPPVRQEAAPPKGETEELAKQQASELISRMKDTSQPPLKGELQAIGVFRADDASIPRPEDSPELPYRDPDVLGQFIEGIDGSRVLTDEVPYRFESATVILLQYKDASYDVVHGLLGNRLLMTTADDGLMLVYAMTDQGRELLDDLAGDLR